MMHSLFVLVSATQVSFHLDNTYFWGGNPYLSLDLLALINTVLPLAL